MTKWHHYDNPNFKEEKCCGNCIHLYDESSMTCCIVHDWMTVTYDFSCNCFDDGERYEE